METSSTNLAFRLQILDKGIGYPRYPLDKIVPNRLFRWGLENLLNPILQCVKVTKLIAEVNVHTSLTDLRCSATAAREDRMPSTRRANGFRVREI